MRYILSFLIFLCMATVACGQNNTLEAKMAYQMAEEKFDAKQYEEALDYLKKAETALGSTNPPMAYLKVMIANQLVAANESTEAYNNLENAIAGFEKNKDKEALGEEKQMDVYRIKMDLDKRKAAFEKEAGRMAALEKKYEEMIYRVAAEFPKTETTVSDFVKNVPATWEELRYGGSNYLKVTDKRINKFIGWGRVDFNGTSQEGKFYLESLSTHNPGEDRIKKYSIRKVVKYHSKKKDNKERIITMEEIGDVLKIPAPMWKEFTTGTKPLIKTDKRRPEGYWITYLSNEKKVDGEHKYLQMFIYEKTWGWTTEEIRIDIFGNTL